MEKIPLKHHDALEWQATDFYYHPKGILWYLATIIIAGLVASVPWLLSGREDYISSGVIILAFLALIIYAGRKPQERSFALTDTRLSVQDKHFDLFTFSRYWVESFPTHTQITLVGLKRTEMPVTLYIEDQKTAKEVIERLRTLLPESNPSQNPADWLTRKIKF